MVDEMGREAEEVVDGQPETDPEADVMFKVGDREYPREKVAEYIKRYENDSSWQAKNTQRAMELAEMERGLSKSKQLEEYLNKHPEQYAKVEAIFKEQQATGNAGAMPKEMAETIARMEELEQSLTTRDASIQLKNDLADLKDRYAEYFEEIPDLDKQVVKWCMDKDVMNLEAGLRYVVFDKAKESGIRQGQQKLKKAQGVSQSLGMPKGSKGVPGDVKSEILKTKSMSGAIGKYLDAYENG